jgi:hypothetical protein
VGARLRVAAVATLTALVGCGEDDEKASPACPSDREAVLTSLARAPAPVRVNGVPLSKCLTKGSNAEEVQRVGAAYVEAAGFLEPRARRNPEGKAALRLGYLVGAARRGSSTTQGIHSELVRRLNQEAALLERRSGAFRRGERAGRRLG